MILHIGEYDDIFNFSSERYIQINSCGPTISKNIEYRVVRKKGRNDYQILYVVHGECFVWHNNTEYKLEAGDYVIYFPHEKQEYRYTGVTDTLTYWIHFTGASVEEIFSDAHLTSGVYFAPINKSVQSCFKKIITFHSLQKYEIQANAYLLSLISSLSLGEGEKSASEYPQYLIDAIKYINLNWQNPISITLLAEKACLSKSRFLHSFKENVGTSAYSYIVNIKIEKAKELLLSTDMNISTVAETVGYSDSLYFSRLFKKHIGISPKEYRKNPVKTAE